MSVMNLKLKVLPKFPASVTVGSGLTLTNTNGAYSITLDSDLAQIAALTLGPNQGVYWPVAGVPAAYSLTATGIAFAGAGAATSGGVPYFSSTTTVASSAALTQHGVVIGGGAGAAPAALAVGASKSVLQGATGADPAFTTTPTVAGLTVNANAASLPAAPAQTIVQVGNADANNTLAVYEAFGGGTITAGVQFRKARNTAAAPQALAADDPIGGIYALGYGATAYSTSQRGFAGHLAAEAWTDTAQGTYFSIYTTATGGTSSTEKVRVGADGMVTLTGTGGIVNGNSTKLSIGGLAPASEILGTTQATATFAVGLFDATASDAPNFNFYRSKSATIGSATVVASGDALGKITWYGAQQTGTFATQNPAAQIRAEIDAAVTSGAAGDMPGRIVLATTADGAGTLTDRLTIDSTGLATFTGRITVNDILTVAAGQIAFPAAQNASAGANTLDDYEEGSWTPAITYATPGTFNANGGTYVGSYTKVGRMVTLWGVATTGAMTLGTASGFLQVTGLPFAAVNTANLNYYSGCSWSGITKAGYTNIVARVAAGAQLVDFPTSGSGVAGSLVGAADTPTGGIISLGFSVPYST